MNIDKYVKQVEVDPNGMTLTLVNGKKILFNNALNEMSRIILLKEIKELNQPNT